MSDDEQHLPCFDLALTMAGAISAGAYTAGVIDFLIQALDAWEARKAAGDPVAPRHAVRLRAVSGASAGAIAAAILGACLRHDFPHRRLGDPGDGSDNPLYDSWVNMIDIRHLLETRDLGDQARPVSVLDSTRLLEIARKAMDYGQGVPAKARPYLVDPLRFIFTITNLRGVPFQLDLGGTGYSHPMMMHGDTMRFALAGLGGGAAPALRAEEYALRYPDNGPKWGGTWETFATAALASGAFPVGLAPRELGRRTSDYARLPVVVPGGPGEPARVLHIRPAWSARVNPDPGSGYRCVNVDGGTIDNEPLELARVELAGGDPLARNERDGRKADRAVIMIDPFVGPEKHGPSTMAETWLLSALVATFTALKNQARFRPQDVALASEDTIYSRFLIAPVRQDRVTADSGSSLACGSLGGFGGFLHPLYRQHDFFLGRRNCQRFLAQHLTLPAENPLFRQWTAEQKEKLGIPGQGPAGPGALHLPVIPLMPDLNPRHEPRAEEREPDWPRGVVVPLGLQGPIETRLDALFGALAHERLWDQKVRGFFFLLGWRLYAKPKITAFVIDAISRQLCGHDLI
ncbi:MAG: patatin [Thermodesulfobacteriota bacterium]